MDAYSLDLRLSILRACDEEDDTREGVADTFGVSRSFVQKLLRQRSTTGWIVPKPHTGGPPPKLDEAALAELRAILAIQPDATLAELCLALKDHGQATVSQATVCRALQRLHLPVKKSRCMRTSGTHRGSGRCGAGGGEKPGRPTRNATFSWTKVGPTPR